MIFFTSVLFFFFLHQLCVTEIAIKTSTKRFGPDHQKGDFLVKNRPIKGASLKDQALICTGNLVC